MNRYIDKAEKFLINCLFDGLAHSYDVISQKYVKPYPEVTGYLVKYFCDIGEKDCVEDAGRYLMKIQHNRGGFKTFFNSSYLYAFDTAQILNGWISLYKRIKDDELIRAIEKAGQFLIFMQRKDGAIYPVYDVRIGIRRMPKKMYEMWNGPTSGLLCKLTEVYNAMYDLTNDEIYKIASTKTTRFYKNVTPIVHSHPLGYWLEGLFAGGENDFVGTFLEKNVIPRIERNGFMSYTPETDYSYTSGQIQLAILMAKLGIIEPALLIRDFVRNVQGKHYSGGIFQYSDRMANLDNHIHTEINSWGTKYYCELERLTENYE